jgi:hypothetical protein
LARREISQKNAKGTADPLTASALKHEYYDAKPEWERLEKLA